MWVERLKGLKRLKGSVASGKKDAICKDTALGYVALCNEYNTSKKREYFNLFTCNELNKLQDDWHEICSLKISSLQTDMVASNLPEAITTTATTTGKNASRAPRSAAPIYTPSEEAANEAIHDAELLRRFHAGEEHVFSEIMNRYSTRIFGLANNLLHNTADAEEVTQDTFIRAHRALKDFRGDSSLATWLYRIALNLARNRYWYFFRRHRQDSISLETQIGADHGSTATFSDCIAATSHTPVQETVTEEFTTLIAACMERLDTRQREILTMRNTLNLPYDEIAAALRINVGTVKSRIARARETLRELLAETAPEFAHADEPGDYFEFTRLAPGCETIAYA